MKTKLAAFVAIVGLLALSTPARAEFISVSADLPMTFAAKFSGTGTALSPDASVSGLKLGVKLPFFMGLGLENYTASLNATTMGTPAALDYAVTMYDIFFTLPIPFINIVLGVGLGSGQFGADTGPNYKAQFETGAFYQYWVSGGISIAIVDIHVGVHMLSGTHLKKTGSVAPSDLNVSATMMSLGAKVGF